MSYVRSHRQSAGLSWSAALAALLMSLTGCRGAVPLQTTTPVMLTSQTPTEDVRAAIVRALEARSFAHREEQPGLIQAQMNHRGVTLELAIRYDNTGYRIDYVSSQNLGYRQSPNGGAVISASYPRHVQRLRNAITDELGRPERERLEAIEAERDHQLALAQEETRRRQAAIDAERDQQDRQRDAELERHRLATERERLRTRRAQVRANANRPVVVQQPSPPPRWGRRGRARNGSIQVRGRRFRQRDFDGFATGTYAAADLGLPNGCPGFFGDAPEHVLQTDGRALTVETSSRGDVVLVLVSADGSIWCDDDSGEGTNARLTDSFPPGTYRAFVGTYRAGERVGYRLHVENAPPPPAVVQANPGYGPAIQPGLDVRRSPRAVGQTRFRELLEHYRSVPVYAQQPGAAAQLVRSGNWFTCAQITEFIAATHVYAHEVDVAVALYRHAVDPENSHLITSAFRIYASADAFRSRANL